MKRFYFLIIVLVAVVFLTGCVSTSVVNNNINGSQSNTNLESNNLGAGSEIGACTAEVSGATTTVEGVLSVASSSPCMQAGAVHGD